MLWVKRLCQVFENKRGRSRCSELVFQAVLIFSVKYISASFCHDILVGKAPLFGGMCLWVGAGAYCVAQADLQVIDSGRSFHPSFPRSWDLKHTLQPPPKSPVVVNKDGDDIDRFSNFRACGHSQLRSETHKYSWVTVSAFPYVCFIPPKRWPVEWP